VVGFHLAFCRKGCVPCRVAVYGWKWRAGSLDFVSLGFLGTVFAWLFCGFWVLLVLVSMFFSLLFGVLVYTSSVLWGALRFL
jgi:hypothetical protein